jgi:DNA replicative helicase MCM subunit Mcm2 (Cdc46/Mcm family)
MHSSTGTSHLHPSQEVVVKRNNNTNRNHPSHSDQLRQNVLVKQYYCDIDIAHLISYNEELAHKLTTEPADIIPLVRAPSSGQTSALQDCS